MVETSIVQSKYPVISVWLSGKNDGIKKFFRCPICGHKVFAYYNSGEKIQITDLAGEFNNGAKEIFCKGSIKIETGDTTQYQHCKTIIRIE